MKVKTSDLSGAGLAYAVSQVMKLFVNHPERFNIGEFGPLFGKGYYYPAYGTRKYNPVEDWKECGILLEIMMNLGYELAKSSTGQGHACLKVDNGKIHCQYGYTPQTAICRAFVMAHCGNEVEIPSELLG